MVLDWVAGYLTNLGQNLVDPHKRLFMGYLVSASLVAFAWGAFASVGSWRHGVHEVAHKLFSKALWWGDSSRADYKLVVANQAVMMTLTPLLVSRVALTTFLYFALHDAFGSAPRALESAPGWFVVGAFTGFQFLLDDASRYVVHRTLHQVRWLWSFHKVHHCAEVLTPITVLRSHPVEVVLFGLRSSLTQAISIALFVYLFSDKVTLLSVFGVQLFLFVFNAFGSNLRHSPIPVRYGTLVEQWLVSPAQHQLHHSRSVRHHDRNFGAVLAIWDRLGGSLLLSEHDERLQFGLPVTHGSRPHALRTLYFEPFSDAARVIRGSVAHYLSKVSDFRARGFTHSEWPDDAGVTVSSAAAASPVVQDSEN